MSGFTQVLNDLRGRLRDEGVPFAIGGAFALAAHGHPRFTNDLDVMVDTPSLDPVHRALAGEGYSMMNEITFQDADSGLVIDIIPVEDPAQEEVFQRSKRVELYGAKDVRVISPEGLAIMLLREATIGDPDRRPERLRDVEVLAREQTLDWSYILEWVEKMGYQEAYGELRVEEAPELDG